MDKIEYAIDIIEALDLTELNLSSGDFFNLGNHLQSRFQKLPGDILIQLLAALQAPAPLANVAVDELTGWVTCIAEAQPPQVGTDIQCPTCHAPIGTKCRTSSGQPSRYHSLRAQIDGNRNYDLERSAWFQRAKAGEVDFCKCSICYSLIKQFADQEGITCEEMEHKVRTAWR